jgi:hypothetical protein
MELYHAVSSTIICFALIQDNYNQKIGLVLNVLSVAAIATEGESTLGFINVLKQAIT